MKKKIITRAAVFFLLTLILTINIQIPAQEQQKEEEKTVDVMDMSLEELLEVEITTASKKPEKVGDIPASIVIVTREDIENYGYQTLGEVLESIPGLYQTDDYLTQNFGVRGFWTIIPQRNFIILVNDVPQTDGLTSGNWLQQINLPVEAIDKIEVVRGPMAVIYGSGAFFGVINIKTNILEPYNPINIVSASVGSENTHKLFARSSGKQLDFQYAFNASYSHTDGLDIPYEDITDVNALPPDWGVKPGDRIGGKLKNNEKYFNFSGQFKGFSFNSSFTESNRHTFVVLPSIEDGTLLNTRSLRVAFGYTKELSEKAKIDTRFTYLENRFAYDYKWFSPDFLGIEDDEARAYFAELNFFLNPSRKLDITVGLNYRKIMDIKNELSAPALGIDLWRICLDKGESIITHALFTQWNYNISSHLKIIAGFRLEQIPKYTMLFKRGDIANGIYLPPLSTIYDHPEIQFIPRVALIYNFDRRNVIKLLYGKAINQPSFSQMAEDVYFVNPNPEDPNSTPRQKPTTENIQTFELNYVGQYSSELILTASIFRNMLDNLIFRTMYVENGVVKSYFGNVGKMNTTGIEVTIQIMPGDKFSAEFSATYQDTKEDNRDGVKVANPPGYSPHFLGYFKTIYTFAKNISLAITGNYVSPMESYYDLTLTDNEGKSVPARLGRKVDGYLLLGANLRIKKIFGTGMYLDIRGSNLLDQKIYYPTTSNNFNFATKGTVGRGMSFLLTLGWKF
ncbi:MAG: TonB-dependent receptor [Acidobacteria bacterium]|jgi:outer membrane receptor protein involved in Fe transport|nr:TonB-dependent receptor [Acidobacteriota bacterium]